MESLLLENFEPIVHTTLDIFEDISNKAKEYLQQEGFTGEGLTANAMTDQAFLNLQNAKNQTEKDQWILKDNPTFMRVDLEDVDGNYVFSMYVTPVISPTGLDKWRKQNLNFISSRAAKGGNLASLDCGSDWHLTSNTEYYVRRKIKFTPKFSAEHWDGFEVVITTKDQQQYIDSFRDFLNLNLDSGDINNADEILEKLRELENTEQGKIKSLTRSIRTGMSLRSQAALDQYQDKIIRLPVNSQLVLLGPPGTGKTTTLIKRLGQKLDTNEGSFEEKEINLLKKLNKNGFNHWMMFTPSELLKGFLKEAFAKEGIVTSDFVLKTWEYSHDIARQKLNILSSPENLSGYRLSKTEHVKKQYIDDPRIWVQSFTDFFMKKLSDELVKGLQTIEQTSGLSDEALIQKIKEIVLSDSDVHAKYKALYSLENQINKVIKKEKEISDKIIREEKNRLINKNNNFLEEFARFLGTLNIQDVGDEDEDEADTFDEDEEEVSIGFLEQNKALVKLQTFLKKIARYTYLKRTLPKTSKDSKIKEWLGERLPDLDKLNSLGRSISLQNGLRHNLNCWKRLYKLPTKFYRQFRKDEKNNIFYAKEWDGQKISQTELDLILFITLREIKKLLKEPYVVKNIDEAKFVEIKNFQSDLFKDQVLVDEATDFSVLQLACMYTMTQPVLDSFIACGDFNQRLTNQGIKDESLLQWISPKLKTERITTIYRQSPKLNSLTHGILDLMDDSDESSKSKLQKFANPEEGLAPVLMENLSDVEMTAEWITKRIVEIERLVNTFNDGQKLLPSIVVLVKSEPDVEPMTEALNEYLADYSLKADACNKGRSLGGENNIRVCNIEYIKGLEFEAVFFVNIDELMQEHPDLYQKYLYVGATRAANYLGMTCSDELPSTLEDLRPYFGHNWRIENL
ncbi:ATP-binding domain-containing protein [Acinetobacter baumannii]|uniref:ATP-binding domain-containing protein n=1 Tax=Acinetobacter TaxID=469 RepID=UPI001CDB9944|nr:ATP-binding domain-containing protein [Acinetobacter baumannii]MCA4443850.1 ATP-dependent helicase [Acinetobacter baumannii]WKA71202.1 ATP-binding domain-containing protein [Acinetobacter baumannii]